jgi:iron complex outermembrane receptor protein
VDRGSGSYVRGTLRESGQPLPSIRPLKGHVAVRWQRSEWTAHVALTGAAAQHRLGEFETPTAAWLATSCGAGWILSRATGQISAQIMVNNLFNAEYRDHLSRIKSVMPEAGRKLRLTIQALL